MIKHFYIKFFILFLFIVWLKVDLYAQTDLSPTESVCEGELRSYRVEGNSGSNIFWTITGGVIVNDGIDQGTSFSETTVVSGAVYQSVIQIRWGSSGNYQVIAREETASLCISGDLVLDVTVNPLPDISALNFTVSSPVCFNTSPILTVTGLNANTDYTIGYNDNGTSKSESVTTDGSGSAVLTTDAITANATYNIESVAFNDAVTNCESNPAPSLAAKSASVETNDPTIFCVTNQTKAADSGQCYYTVSGTEFDLTSYSDDCLVANVVNDFNGGTSLNGAQIPTGTTTITWTVTDNAGNSSLCSFDVTVNDDQAPVASVASLTDVTAQCQVTSLIAPTANDNCDGAITGTHNAILPITAQGTTVVTWTYTDAAGNSSNQTQNVVIDDTTAPTITCPGNQNENFTAVCNFTLPDYTGLAVVNDNCDASPVVSQNPIIGSVIAANTTITLTVTDASGNSNFCTFDVILSDAIAPVLNNLSDLNIDDCADDESIIPQVKVFSGLALPAARYSDNCSGTLTVQYRIQLPDASFANNYGIAAAGAVSAADPSGYSFPEGTSTVFFRVLDDSGNISNVESYTISVKHKPNPSDINF